MSSVLTVVYFSYKYLVSGLAVVSLNMTGEMVGRCLHILAYQKDLSVNLGLSPPPPQAQGDRPPRKLVILQTLFDLCNIFVLGNLAEVEFAQSELSIYIWLTIYIYIYM
jgi:hypothetical protein